MYQSFINFLDLKQSKTVHWFVRCRDIFLGIFILTGIFFLLCAAGVSIFSGHFDGGVVLIISGILLFVVYIIARKQKRYNSFSFWVLGLVYSFNALVLLYFKQVELSAVCCIIFSVLISMIAGAKRGNIILLLFFAAYFTCGLMLKNELIFLAICLFSGAVMKVTVDIFLILSEESATLNAGKISNIQKETQIINDFVSQLSYQIRTPLNNIVVIGNLLNETSLNQRQKDWTETILASANNLVNVVNMIASKVTSAGIADAKPSSSVTFDLQIVLNNIVHLFLGQGNDYNIGLKPNMELQHMFEGDPIQVKQIFLTLIDTIIKNKKAEKINIIISYKAIQETDRLYNVMFEIRVSDHLDFESPDETSGTEMLNYSISSKLIDMSGNKLTVAHKNDFTIFRFTLPFKKPVEVTHKDNIPETPVDNPATDTGATKPAMSENNVAFDLKDANILLVEDNLINQKIVILSIQKMVKSIDVANNGQEAVDKFGQAKYNIILMDIQMPIMDGIQATKRIREIENGHSTVPTPIIAITANALAGDREHCLAAGMDEYISKPFQVEVLVSKMKNLLVAKSSF